MADYRDTFTSEIYVNQSQAQDAVEKYTKKLADLNKQLAEIDKSEEGWEKKEKKLQRQIKSTEGTLKGVQTGVENYQKAMNNLDGRSLNNLIKLKKQLNAEIKKLVPGTQEYINRSKDLKKVEERINSLTKATQSMSTRVTSWFTKYWNLFDTFSRTITGVSMKFRQAAEDAAKLDDVYADVMKTTGLLHEEVEGLDKELMQIDTRTSREQLLLLARDAGKLGIQGKEDILGFVRAVDQIQVALGEDLGEGAIKNLGKIADVFGLTKEMGIEKSLLSIASAVNALGQASTASEAYLVDFTQRLAGVGAMAGLSVQDILGFASGLDQSAMKVEMAATAFQKFLMKMYEDTATFAEYAGMEVEDFSNLLKTNANEAITTVMKAMNGQDGFASLVPMFDQMGLDGARAVTVLASMTQNLEAVTEAQALANVEFEKATSVTEEYTTKNNNLQAQLEKARKEFKNASIALGQSLNPILLKSTKATTYLIKALASYGKEIKTILIVTAALTVVLKAKVIWMKAVATWNATLRTGSLALAAAQALLAGNVTRAAAAWRLMNTAMKASVIGIVIAAISGLIIWIQRLNKETKHLTELQKFEKKLTEDVAKATSDEAARVKALKAIVEDTNQAYQERKLALQELKRIVPEYHADLTEEGTLINNNTEALNNYINAMLQAAKTQALQDKLKENANKQFEQEQYLTENAPSEFRDELGNWRRKYSEAGPERDDGTSGIITHWISQDCEAAIDRLEEFKKEEELILDMIRKAGENGITTATNGSGDNGGGASNNAELTEAQFNYLQERYDKLTKKEKKLVDAGYAALSVEDSKALKARYDKLMKADIKAEDKRYQEQVKQLQKEQKAKENELLSQYLHSDMTLKQYEERRLQIQKSFLKERLVLAKQEGKDTEEIEAQLLQIGSEKQKQKFDDQLKELNECYADEQRALKMSLTVQEITQDEYDSQMLESKVRYLKEKLELAAEYGQDETAIMQVYQEAIKESQDLAFEQLEKLKKEAKDVKDSLHPKEARANQQDLELKNLQSLYDLKLITEEDFQKKKQDIIKKYNKENLDEDLGNLTDYIEKAQVIMQEASDFVTQLKEMETAQLEAEYQAQLTAAGDNAEEREAIEAEYEKKKLDLQKKYADTEMVINIAKAIAAGALAAIEAFAAAGNPILGAVFAAIIAATTALEVATIVKQRNAIKNASASGGGGAASAPSTGQRTITGHAEGGYTENHTTLSTVGEEGVEWIAPHWMVRDNPTTFANLEHYRKTGSHGRSGSISRGFADGGYTGKVADDLVKGMTTADIEAAVTAAIIKTMATGAIRAYLVRNDLTELDNQDARFKDIFTL